MHRSFTPSEPPEVFISYASKDEDLLEEFEPYLKGLEHRKIIRSWHGRKILPGEDWKKAISDHLNAAQIILLLVSKDFLASEYCYGVEFKLAVDRYKIGAARVISVILRTCDWRSTPLEQFQVLPKGGTPVSRWEDKEAAWVDVANGITKVVKQLDSERQPAPPPIEPSIRRVKRTFPAVKYPLGIAAVVLVALASLFIFTGRFPWSRSVEGNVQIEVTDVPPHDPKGGTTSHGYIAGTVSGARSPEFSLVIYSFTTAWYVQPSTDDPETRIGPDGRWSADIKTGGKYAVLLVHRNYQALSPISTNPTRLSGVITSIEFEGKKEER